MNTALSLKIEKALGMEEGYLMILQIYNEIEKEKKKQNTRHPDLSIIRKILFWDTSFDKIDWEKHKRSIIKRVFQRGNEEEKKEITRFYGKDLINSVTKKKAGKLFYNTVTPYLLKVLRQLVAAKDHVKIQTTK